MGKLYHEITGDVIAVFEDGKVYRDVWMTELIGVYDNLDNIYLKSKYTKKKFIGTYAGDILKHSSIVVGYIEGNNVYSGFVAKNSMKIAHFSGDDKCGAAAAALISGLFEADRRKFQEGI